MKIISAPQVGEYPEYIEAYLQWIPKDGQLLEHLKNNFRKVRRLVRSLTPEQLELRYAPDKWTIRETLVHLIDDERIYAYRALCFARGEAAELPGFDPDIYAELSEAHQRPLENIMAEYSAVRQSTIALLAGLPDSAWLRSGLASGNRSTVRALAYHLAGHEMHHLNLIRTKYLGRRGLSRP